MARKESRAHLEKGRFELQEEIKQLQRYIEHTGERGREKIRKGRIISIISDIIIIIS